MTKIRKKELSPNPLFVMPSYQSLVYQQPKLDPSGPIQQDQKTYLEELDPLVDHSTHNHQKKLLEESNVDNLFLPSSPFLAEI